MLDLLETVVMFLFPQVQANTVVPFLCRLALAAINLAPSPLKVAAR
jgi:hypothetical protein